MIFFLCLFESVQAPFTAHFNLLQSSEGYFRMFMLFITSVDIGE